MATTSHIEKHLKSSDLIQDIVIGMSDGLTVPFALAAGLSSSVSDTSIILTAGAAEIIAGSIAMGLGGYLSGRTEIEHYESELKREHMEVENVPDKEKEEVKEIFADFGLSQETQLKIIEELSKDKNKWVKFMMQYELGLDKPDIGRATKSAFAIGLSYIAGGIIPLSAYFFVQEVHLAFTYSSIITIVSLFVFGYLKSKVTGQNPLTGALKVAGIGTVAAATAYFAAKLFQF